MRSATYPKRVHAGPFLQPETLNLRDETHTDIDTPPELHLRLGCTTLHGLGLVLHPVLVVAFKQTDFSRRTNKPLGGHTRVSAPHRIDARRPGTLQRTQTATLPPQH
uniref:Uncharacterized protein n=1 Tax=Mycena chlorophos TaxID=658473 RepID=A0ABQ0M2L0_MYCCL|nr:predicted protein [Mycena chlorophos]